jgi:hypothetical protein
LCFGGDASNQVQSLGPQFRMEDPVVNTDSERGLGGAQEHLRLHFTEMAAAGQSDLVVICSHRPSRVSLATLSTCQGPSIQSKVPERTGSAVRNSETAADRWNVRRVPMFQCGHKRGTPRSVIQGAWRAWQWELHNLYVFLLRTPYATTY